MLAVILIGYIYDIFGRKFTVFGCFLGSGVVMIIAPMGAPSASPYMHLNRCLFVIFNIGLVVHPFINDYIQKDSRGKASALQTLGSITGDIVNYLIILQLIKNLSIGAQFQVVGVLVIIAAFLILLFITEPQLHKNRNKNLSQQIQSATSLQINERSQINNEVSVVYQDESVLTKAKKLTKHLLWSCVNQCIIPLCFFSNVVVRCNIILLSSFMTLWTTSYIGKGISDERMAQDIVQQYSTYSVLTNLVFVIPLGRMADRFKYKHLITIVTLIKLGSIGCFFFLTNPASLMTTIVYILMVLTHASQNLFTDAVFAKNLHRDIRGSMLAMYQLSGSVGVLVFTKVGALMYDQLGPSYPFLFVGSLDALFLIWLLIIVVFKKFDQ
eukprot:403358894